LLVVLLILLVLSPVLSSSQEPFDYANAYGQLMLSYSAYCPADQLQNWNCFFCNVPFVVTTIVYNTSTDTHGYVGHYGSIIEVVFRGTVTSSLKNWITDLDAGHSVPYPVIPNAFVHTGFLLAWHSVKQQVIAAVQDLRTKINAIEIYFSGHSLGAAISVLAALEAGISTGLPITCYNFGDPRVGNQAFADYFDKNIQTSWRLVNQHDIVPHLPTLTMGFWHIATEVWFTNLTHYMICNDSGEDPNCSDSLRIALSIDDHLEYLGFDLRDGHPSGCK